MKLENYALVCRADGSEYVISKADVRYIEPGERLVTLHPDVHGLVLARHLDAELESGNYHSLVGLYEKLYTILKLSLPFEQADMLFDKVAEKGLVSL